MDHPDYWDAAVDWAVAHKRELEYIDEESRALTGPKPAGTVVSVMAATVYRMMAGYTMKSYAGAAKLLRDIGQDQRDRVGLAGPISNFQCRGVWRRIELFFISGKTVSPALQALFDCLINGSAPPPLPNSTGTYAGDGSLIDGWCRPVGNAAFKAGKEASDKDAGPRKYVRDGVVVKKAFGYNILAFARAEEGQPEYVDAFTIIPAHHSESAGMRALFDRLLQTGHWVQRVLIDRGISQDVDLLNHIRNQGVHATFDVKTRNGPGIRPLGQTGHFIVNGIVLISCTPPELLEREVILPSGKPEMRPWTKPAADASDEDWDTWYSHLKKLAPYMFRPHGRDHQSPTSVRLQHPFHRNGVRCEDDKRTENLDGSLPYCPGGHAPGTGCLVNTIILRAEDCPEDFQWPMYGTPEHTDLYGDRTAIERVFSKVKDEAYINFKRGTFRMRRIVKVGLMACLAMVAYNLRLSVDHASGRKRPPSRE